MIPDCSYGSKKLGLKNKDSWALQTRARWEIEEKIEEIDNGKWRHKETNQCAWLAAYSLLQRRVSLDGKHSYFVTPTDNFSIQDGRWRTTRSCLVSHLARCRATCLMYPIPTFYFLLRILYLTLFEPIISPSHDVRGRAALPLAEAKVNNGCPESPDWTAIADSRP